MGEFVIGNDGEVGSIPTEGSSLRPIKFDGFNPRHRLHFMKKKNKLKCVFESKSKSEAKEQYKFYNTTHKNVRLTCKKGVGYRVWSADN